MSTQTVNKISILIVDDHPLLRMGTRTLLEKIPDFCVVGEAGDEDEARKLLDKFHPTILLLDLVMPDFSPSIFEKWVQENYPETVTLVFTAHHQVAYLANMMDAGAAGYLDKKMEGSDLAISIRRAARGESLFDEQQMLLARYWHEVVEEKWNSLSERERQILCLLADGVSNKDMASHLQIRQKTVEKHLEKIYQKLEVDSRAKAVLWGVRHRGDFPY